MGSTAAGRTWQQYVAWNIVNVKRGGDTSSRTPLTQQYRSTTPLFAHRTFIQSYLLSNSTVTLNLLRLVLFINQY
jgi:hypothetical protein